MKYITFVIIYVACCLYSVAQLPKVSSGTLQRIDSFPSKYVTPRNIDVWLPEGYTTAKKYVVLYMHDGQMLFDSNTTWNHTAWDVDDVLGKLMKDNKIRDVIVVGVWNGGKTRHPDYFPKKPYEALTQIEKDTVTAQLQRAGRTTEVFNPVSDNYLKCLVTEIKPMIDKKYSTYPDAKNTFIAGSSMGGLISMYAICEYPDVFGGAACLSTHWPGIFSVENNPVPEAFIQYMKAHLPNPKGHKIYFDYGDQTLDALYPPLQKKVDEVMKSKGFTDKNWMTRFFPGENHSELAWNKRFDIPMLFLLNK
jgi:enterochelin esterase-like enzyme